MKARKNKKTSSEKTYKAGCFKERRTILNQGKQQISN